MELHVDTNDLARRIAHALREHEEQFLFELVARITRELKATPAASNVVGLNGDYEILGIEPHALYPVSFVADRWDVSEDNVRKKPQMELPRSDWKGGEIRYRGIDILRYEGVTLEEYIGESPSELDNGGPSRSPEAPPSMKRPSPLAEENENGRPYSSDLPALSDEDSSAG